MCTISREQCYVYIVLSVRRSAVCVGSVCQSVAVEPLNRLHSQESPPHSSTPGAHDNPHARVTLLSYRTPLFVK
ncbi:hypothetical protein LSTR_LSTR003236 [Laodelphax striatellus]|uniref:Uncharacterized protein n=1 Tax=Laodelphax striatellus TaxID=195883 RepID=A0A482XSN6_LAOST|nr:hypothetical protein LSTR_LSTR003236 [Laodelphax striatellus]